MPPAVRPYRLWLPAARVCRASRSWERCPSSESIIRGPVSPLPHSWRRQPPGFLPLTGGLRQGVRPKKRGGRAGAGFLGGGCLGGGNRGVGGGGGEVGGG